jgi:AraC-like DNA-binding protein
MDKIIFDTDKVIYFGKITDTDMHKHYAIQITLSYENSFSITTRKKSEDCNFCIIKSNVAHKLVSKSKVMIVLINPSSIQGYNLSKLYLKNITNLETENNVGYAGNIISENDISEKIDKIINQLIKNTKTDKILTDKRIIKALNYLDKKSEKIVSLKKLAEQVFLSESRFIHLFKHETGITFRRMQLWIKITKAMQLFENNKNFTKIAHEVGFADSSHFSRTFKENFGIKPQFFKNSKFVQVS